ncbi:alpha-galactosidase [Novosphingobium sp.]|uniref:alpha-galactosidase n=1 Tax=Novosphingobium sp. TaxID=1874826 RepID=UPI0025FC136A|nr:alpha-galactosidase [Novosphingobium sp.]
MDTFRIDGGCVSLVLSCAKNAPPSIIYWGPRLGRATSADDLTRLTIQQGAHGSPGTKIVPSLAHEPGIGLLGPTGIGAHRGGRDWGSVFAVRDVRLITNGLELACHDPATRIALDYVFSLDPETGVLSLAATLTNTADAPLDLTEMATAILPLPQHIDEIVGFTGRWTGEFQRERFARHAGTYLRENRRGRTSHDSFPGVILCTGETTECAGEAYALTLAWSGNHRVRVDTMSDGSFFASLGALLLPGEICLAPGESYVSPVLIAAYADQGFSALSQALHSHVRSAVLTPAMQAKPRPVHYNTWEAVYFDHDMGRLKLLADRAAAIGVERFVLDDGWFGSRRDDTSGLGDWIVSPQVYPEGLGPLVDHVTALGMEMGIWFEPEMVNPDSDLYRAHPDWALRVPGVRQIGYRDQYVLDISRTEVSDYLFGQIDAVLSDYAISYIKWDMNRDLNHPGGHDGTPRSHAQVGALYALLDRIRAKHPDVEIESCASGGGRTDYGALAHTDRVWTSDSNDAIDRQAIQRGASYFLPLEVLGAHVGPRHCHVTGRKLPMAMRAATALMGHMGLELNLLTEPGHELEELRGAISLYKQYRALLHTGRFFRLDTPSHANAVGVVAKDQTAALFSYAYLASNPRVMPGRLRFVGLDPDSSYRLRLVWPQGWTSVHPPSISEALDLTEKGALFTGDALMKAGLQLPQARPETVLLFSLENA